MTSTVRLTRRAVLALPAALAWPAVARAADNPTLQLGVLNDMSGSYSALSGKGSVLAANMAVEDYRTSNGALPFPVEILSADHQMKADVASSIAREWLNRGVDAIVDVPNTSAALAVQGFLRGSKAVLLASGSDGLTGSNCSPNTVQWAFDLWSLAHGTAVGMVKEGGDSWFFVTADYSGGHLVEDAATSFVRDAGGKVFGHTLPALGTTDYSSYLIQAQASQAKVVALVMAGSDLINAIKQAAEFGITEAGQRLAAPVVFISDVHSLGLQAAQGLVYTTAFDGNLGDPQRAFAERFAARDGGAFPTQIHAGVYASTLHYLKAVVSAGTRNGPAVVARMKELPTDDPLFGHGTIREDGRHMHPMYVVQVKRPAESRRPWDYVKVVDVIPATEAAKKLAAGECVLGKS